MVADCPVCSKFAAMNTSKLKYGVIYTAGSLLSKVVGRMMALLERGEWSSWPRFEQENLPLAHLDGDAPQLVARRVNVGNAGRDAVVTLRVDNPEHLSAADVQRFLAAAADVADRSAGDLTLTQTPPPPLHESVQVSECGSSRRWFPSLRRGSKSMAVEADACEKFAADASCDSEVLCDSEVPSLGAISPPPDDDEEEIVALEVERRQALQALQAAVLNYVVTYHADPAQLMQTLLKGKIVVGPHQKLSPLLVNGELRIVLPHYNEVEIEMPALCRAIYILFLSHPEGIALRNIADCRPELEHIYSLVMPGRDDARARRTLDNLCDPMSNTLNEYISKIKRCVATCIINDDLARHYCITGKRSEAYRIDLDPSLVTLPRAVTER